MQYPIYEEIIFFISSQIIIDVFIFSIYKANKGRAYSFFFDKYYLFTKQFRVAEAAIVMMGCAPWRSLWHNLQAGTPCNNQFQYFQCFFPIRILRKIQRDQKGKLLHKSAVKGKTIRKYVRLNASQLL